MTRTRLCPWLTASVFILWLSVPLWPGFSVQGHAQSIQRIDVPSSFNPVGSGARALGMGGAFIAVADDATAASWNPGGLVQLERPEISIVGAGFHRTEDSVFGTNPEASGPQRVSNFQVNYFSAVHPFTFWGRNMVVSLNYQNLYDLTRQWDYPFASDSAGLVVNKNVDYAQEGLCSDDAQPFFGIDAELLG
jgi:hypothetical protein